MQATMESLRPHAQHPERLSLDKFKLEFKRKEETEESEEEEIERVSQWSMARWFGAVGGKVRMVGADEASDGEVSDEHTT